jgi:hypothetical protein
LESPQLRDTKKPLSPENYNNGTKRYSVLYMHDAQNLFDTKTSMLENGILVEKLDLNATHCWLGIEHRVMINGWRLTRLKRKNTVVAMPMLSDFIVKNTKTGY